MGLVFIVYLIGTVFPVFISIANVLIGVLVMVATIWICGAPLWMHKDADEIRPRFWQGTKLALKWCLPVIFVFMLVPDKETSYTMLAAYGVQSVAENDKVQQLAGDGLDVLQTWMMKAKQEMEEKEAVK